VIFVVTLIVFVFAMLLMALGLLAGRPAIQKRCADECECLGGRRDSRKGGSQ